ncbi:MAG TPA: transglycosylase domain-containing protein [Bacillales bacterium]|nr:transglycosylase domain-containing protein [Bacillales bacterium]
MSFEPSDFRTFMKKAMDSIQSSVQFLREKHIFKGFRVTYKVIWNLFLIFVILGFMGTFFAVGAGAGYFASLVRNEPIMSYAKMKKDIYNYSETSEIYFAHDVLLGKMPTDLVRFPVELNDVSDWVKKALIATEDRNFRQHHGVVPKAVMRALFQELTNAPIITGGSTLTQQLVKNQILTPEVSFKRKAKEMLYAMRIERFFSKSEILQAYLNVVPFGRNASGQNIAGIQAAAQGVFGVDADELNLPQAAFLAGMPQNPFTYTPFQNAGGVKDDLSAGIDRMHTVLKRMLNAGFISKEKYKKAMHYNIKKHLAKPKKSTYGKYPAVTTEVRRRAKKIIAEQLAEKQGYDGKELAKHYNDYRKYVYEQNHPRIGTANPDWAKHADKLKKDHKLFARFKEIAGQKLSRSGYKIYTTIDKKIYDAWQKVTKNYPDYEHWVYYKNPATGKFVTNPETGKKWKYYQQVAAVLIDNDTGAVLSFVGGRDYEHQQYNMATQALRNNGSSMKPLLVYSPAMEMGLANPGSIVADLPYDYPGTNKALHNYSYHYHGLETVRKALYRSHNIPAVKTYYKEMQHGKPRKYLKKMGVTSLVGGNNPSLGIGSLNWGISVLENTNAYDTFGNGGKFVDAYMIKKITDAKGNVIYQHHVDPVRVFSPQTNYMMIDMMRDVLGPSGTAGALPDYLDFHTDWAGKTGTSQYFYDEWFEATNPNVTLGTWIGYKPRINLQEHSGNNGHSYYYSDYNLINLKLWADYANAAHDVRPKLMDPKERFHMPTGVVRRSVCLVSGLLPSDTCRQAGLTVTDLFNQNSAPSKTGHVLSKGGYVVVHGKKYIAHGDTPGAFVQQGLLIDKDYMKNHFVQFNMDDLLQYDTYYFRSVSANWTDKVIPAHELHNNGKTPSHVTGVSISGGNLHWNQQPERDIVGYRIYASAQGSNAFRVVGTVIADGHLAYPVHSAGAYAYYVTAVDIDGNESGPSNIVKSGNWAKPEPKKKDKNTGGNDNKNDKPASGDTSGNNGDNNGKNGGDTGGTSTTDGNSGGGDTATGGSGGGSGGGGTTNDGSDGNSGDGGSGNGTGDGSTTTSGTGGNTTQ